MEQVQDEPVRVLRLDPESSQDIRRKISQVRGDNHVGSSADRRGENMPIVGVGKL